MIAIIDYGVGNIFSLKSSFKKIGADAVLTSDIEVIKAADKIVLPGVGAFGDAAEKLKASGLFEVIKDVCKNGKPLLGICLGMQLLFEKGYEYGEHEGLGLIKGNVRFIGDYITPGLKIPHIGWNSLSFPKENKIFKYLNEGDFVYFVHSYKAECENENIAAYSEYGGKVPALVFDGKFVYGAQFHPEKSGETGLKILRSFGGLI